jgi:hypothetical protein
MRVTKRINRDAGREVQVTVAVGRDQPSALAPFKSEIDARVSRQDMRRHGQFLSRSKFPK